MLIPATAMCITRSGQSQNGDLAVSCHQASFNAESETGTRKRVQSACTALQFEASESTPTGSTKTRVNDHFPSQPLDDWSYSLPRTWTISQSDNAVTVIIDLKFSNRKSLETLCAASIREEIEISERKASLVFCTRTYTNGYKWYRFCLVPDAPHGLSLREDGTVGYSVRLTGLNEARICWVIQKADSRVWRKAVVGHHDIAMETIVLDAGRLWRLQDVVNRDLRLWNQRTVIASKAASTSGLSLLKINSEIAAIGFCDRIADSVFLEHVRETIHDPTILDKEEEVSEGEMLDDEAREVARQKAKAAAIRIRSKSAVFDTSFAMNTEEAREAYESQTGLKSILKIRCASMAEDLALWDAKAISEPGSRRGSMQKTVRFDDKIQHQVFKPGSSILGQRKKNQRKNRARQQRLRRTMSEGSYGTETEEEHDLTRLSIDETTFAEGETDVDAFEAVEKMTLEVMTEEDQGFVEVDDSVSPASPPANGAPRGKKKNKKNKGPKQDPKPKKIRSLDRYAGVIGPHQNIDLSKLAGAQHIQPITIDTASDATTMPIKIKPCLKSPPPRGEYVTFDLHADPDSVLQECVDDHDCDEDVAETDSGFASLASTMATNSPEAQGDAEKWVRPRFSLSVPDSELVACGKRVTNRLHSSTSKDSGFEAMEETFAKEQQQTTA